MNDHFCIAVAASNDPGEQEQPSTNPVEEFGHFVNATLLQETRSFIIATLIVRGNVIENRNEIISQH